MRRGAALAAVLSAALWVCGCAPRGDERMRLWRQSGMTPVAARARSYGLELSLFPAEHRLEGNATVNLELEGAHPNGSAGLGFRVHPGIRIEAAGGPHVAGLRGPVRSDGRDHYIVALHEARSPLTVELRFSGQLTQDVSAGEKQGEIHNLSVDAHIGPDGVYLAEDAHWYPHVYTDEDAAPPAPEYTLTVQPIEGFTLLAGCDREPGDAGAWRWRSARGLPGLSLAGGPRRVTRRQAGAVQIEAHVSAERAAFAEPLLEAVASYLAEYEPLIGAYPYRHFAVVENFFSSGFAYPTFTLLGPAVIDMGPRGLRPGYLDHELVHNWWGNGVYVDPRDGNWCEALTSYCTNYYQYILDDQPHEARRHRRNIVNSISLLPEERNGPLRRFGLEGGPARFIGYQKGEMVFHMLARVIGEERLFEALRNLRRDHLGQFVDWNGLQQAFEQAAGRELGGFFEYWVNGEDLPRVQLRSAEYHGATRRLKVAAQCAGVRPGEIIPLRVHFAGGADPREIRLPACGVAEVTLEPAGGSASPVQVELDPDFHLLRRLDYRELMPTLNFVTRGALCIVAPAESGTPYDAVIAAYSRKGTAIRTPADLRAGDLRRGNLLILGDAARDPRIQALLESAGGGVQWLANGFAVEDQTFTAPGDALLVTVHHPGDENAMIAVYAGNADAALTNAGLIGFYPDSLLVFQEGRPAMRRDFESVAAIPVTLR